MSIVHANYVVAVEEIIKNGYTFLDVNLPFLVTHRKSIKAFIERRLSLGDIKNWVYLMPGEEETEAGLVLPRVGKDLKYSFHDSHFLRQQIQAKAVILTKEDEEFLRLNKKLYEVAGEISANLIKVLGIKFCKSSLLDNYYRTTKESIPYSITILRGLYYPEALEQKGAKKHIDKNLVTVHFGDTGGSLVSYQDVDDPVGKTLFIPEGKAVAFFGVKILWVTKGKVQPLWHGSITEGGKERLANPFFAHTSVEDYLVKDAREAYDYFYTSN